MSGLLSYFIDIPRNEHHQESIKKYFQQLDNDFINIQRVVNEKFIYNAQQVLIQNTWELPIIVQWPESTIKFRFSVEPGDIFFGVAFVGAIEEGQDKSEAKVEIIEDVDRVTLDETEEIEGSFRVPCEGVVVFIWDNNYDYFSCKKLSYHVEVYEPSFSVIDRERTFQALKTLRNVTQDIKTYRRKIIDAKESISQLTCMNQQSEGEIANLKSTLDDKKIQLADSVKEKEESSMVIQLNNERVLGIAIRCLSKKLLSVVFSFMTDDSCTIGSVCKYWQKIISEMNSGIKYDEYTPIDTQVIPIRKPVRVKTTPPPKVFSPEKSTEKSDFSDVNVKSLNVNKMIVSKELEAKVNTIKKTEIVIEELNITVKNDNIFSNIHNIPSNDRIQYVIDCIENNYEDLEELKAKKVKFEDSYLLADQMDDIAKLHEGLSKLAAAIKLYEEHIEATLNVINLTHHTFMELKFNSTFEWDGRAILIDM